MMEKAQRAELLRQRFRAVGGVAYAGSGRARKQRHEPKPWRNMAWPEINPDTKRAPDWMREADAKPKLTVRVKHNTGKPIMAKIAEKTQPRKLVRKYRDAETLLASRARQ